MNNFEYIMWGSLIIIETLGLTMNFVVYKYFHKRRLKEIDNLSERILNDRVQLMNIVANRPYKVEIVKSNEIPNHT